MHSRPSVAGLRDLRDILPRRARGRVASSGKSLAILFHRAVCKTPLPSATSGVVVTRILGAASSNPLPPRPPFRTTFAGLQPAPGTGGNSAERERCSVGTASGWTIQCLDKPSNNSPRHCEKRSAEAIQPSFAAPRLDCFACARNDAETPPATRQSSKSRGAQHPGFSKSFARKVYRDATRSRTSEEFRHWAGQSDHTRTSASAVYFRGTRHLHARR